MDSTFEPSRTRTVDGCPVSLNLVHRPGSLLAVSLNLVHLQRLLIPQNALTYVVARSVRMARRCTSRRSASSFGVCHNARVEIMIGVSGGEVWAEDSGGDGPPLVLLHPGWGDSSIWDPMLAALAQLPRQFRVVRYDTRGFGKSPAPATAYTHLADLIAVLDHLQVARAALVAHSGGGSPAMSLALAQPERVRQLILVAPGVQDYPWPTADPYFAEFGRLFEAGDRDGLAALGLQTWAAAGADPAAQAQVRGAVAAFFRQGEFERPDPPLTNDSARSRPTPCW
jgi:3-oxoadipate enol-lactonase